MGKRILAVWRLNIIFSLLLLFAVAGSSSAAAQSGGGLNVQLFEKLEGVERDLRTLEKFIYGGSSAAGVPPPPKAQPRQPLTGGNLADAELRMSDVETKMRELTGQVQALTRKIDVIGLRLDKMAKDIELRFADLEKQVRTNTKDQAVATTIAAPAKSAADAPRKITTAAKSGDGAIAVVKPGEDAASGKILPEGDVQLRYDFAMNLVRISAFAKAEGAYKEFLDAHGEHPLAANAQYWLAETYYARAMFTDAARAFLVGFQNYPNAAKAPDSLLKLAITLAKLGQNAEACVTLGELEERFDKVSNSNRRRVARIRKEASCR